MPTLITAGDSFTHGLVKVPHEYYCHTYGNTLAEKLGLAFINIGHRGFSNWDIYHSIIDTDINPDDYVIVMWSGLYREPHLTYSDFKYNRDDNNVLPYSELLSNSITAIELAHAYLTDIGCNFVFTTAFSDYKQDTDFDIPGDIKLSFIDWDTPNNSAYDICSGYYGVRYNLIMGISEHDYVDPIRNEDGIKFSVFDRRYIAGCHHPTQAGHDLIADKYLDELKRIWRL